MSETVSQVCPWCGLQHVGTCPRVRAMDFYELTGKTKRVEFFEPKAEKICQHQNKYDFSVSGLEYWRCKDCGYEYKRELI